MGMLLTSAVVVVWLLAMIPAVLAPMLARHSDERVKRGSATPLRSRRSVARPERRSSERLAA